MKAFWVLFIRLGLLFVLTCWITGVLFLYFYSYEEFTAIVFTSVEQNSKLEKFRELLLTRERFFLLRIIALTISILAFVALPFLWKRAVYAIYIPARLAAYIKSYQTRFISFWKGLPTAAKYNACILFLLIIVSRIYFVFRFPFHVDERFTYLYFVNKGIAVSMAYYPGPNNHILYTLICNLFDIFINKPILVMKVPALLIGWMLSVAFWIVVSRFFTYPLALVTTALFSFAEPVFYYSMQGRGYILLMFFVLIATCSAIRIIQYKKYAFEAFFWLWLSCTLGFYTIPIFLYPFVSLLIFVSVQLFIQRKYTLFKPLLFTSAAITGFVLLLYLPVVIFNGPDALTSNTWVIPEPWKEYTSSFLQHLIELASGIWGIFPYGVWLTGISIVFCLGIIVSKQATAEARQWMQVYLINLAVIMSLSFLQRLLLPVRVIFYLSIYQYVVFAYACHQIVQVFYNNFNKVYLKAVHSIRVEKQLYIKSSGLLLAAILILGFISLSNYKFQAITAPGQFSLYKSFDATAQWLISHNADNIFVNEYDYSLCIRFLYETSGREIQLDTNQPEPDKQYTYLVIDASRPFPSQLHITHYQQVYRSEEVIIYRRLPHLL